MLDLDLPNMVQMDCSLLSGLLAEALTKRTASISTPFSCAATQAQRRWRARSNLARATRARTKARGLGERAFHGLVINKLSLMGCASFTEGFGPLMEGFGARITLDDVDALDRQLRSRERRGLRDRRAVQGKGCKSPKTDFFVRAQELCRKVWHRSSFPTKCRPDSAAPERWGASSIGTSEPDDPHPRWQKTLSGGYMPCSGVVTRRQESIRRLSAAWIAASCIRQPSGATTSRWPADCSRGSR